MVTSDIFPADKTSPGDKSYILPILEPINDSCNRLEIIGDWDLMLRDLGTKLGSVAPISQPSAKV
jgi:hypothetical protein